MSRWVALHTIDGTKVGLASYQKKVTVRCLSNIVF